MTLLGLALLEPLEPAEGAVDLVLGVLADAAGVEQDRVGLRRCRRSARSPRCAACRRPARCRARSSGSRRFRCRASCGGDSSRTSSRFPVLADRGPTRRLVAEAEGRGRTGHHSGLGIAARSTRRDTSNCIRLAPLWKRAVRPGPGGFDPEAFCPHPPADPIPVGMGSIHVLSIGVAIAWSAREICVRADQAILSQRLATCSGSKTQRDR